MGHQLFSTPSGMGHQLFFESKAMGQELFYSMKSILHRSHALIIIDRSLRMILSNAMMSLDNGQIYCAKRVKHLLKVALYDSHRHTED